MHQLFLLSSIHPCLNLNVETTLVADLDQKAPEWKEYLAVKETKLDTMTLLGKVKMYLSMLLLDSPHVTLMAQVEQMKLELAKNREDIPCWFQIRTRWT